MKSAVLTTVAATALIYAATAGAHLPRLHCDKHLAPKVELRCATRNMAHARGALAWAKSTERKLALFDVGEDSTQRRALRQVVRDHLWLLHVSEQRVAEARSRLAAAMYPPHHALWLCISRYEGSPTSDNGSHYGMLQMHADWGYGTSHHASDDPQLVQEWAAERAYKASGYSRSFLYGQWFDYDAAAGECLPYA